MRIFGGSEFIRGVWPGDMYLYDRFVTLVKKAILSVAWKMNMWMLKNGSQKTAVKFGRVEKGNFKVIFKTLGLLFF